MAIKFCVKLGKTAAETLPIIKTAFKKYALSDRQGFRWHKVFLGGREEVDDEARAGRPSTSTTDDNVTRVKELLNTDRRLNVRLLSQLLDTLIRVQRVRPDIAKDWKLHHDNAPAHSSFLVTNYLVKAGMPTIPQPPYSPDVAPPEFFLFLRLKRPMKGKHFETIERIQAV
ncbi:PREDICTED: putative uncharacterized protein FLJ37770 [Dinoponera quadriceps]|uniref:Mos1 transposase HTH domain-containing protein n=1 Tax=Dinoponera quadriceps TaxID=609295 RepID=A0A6P3XY10_DINQU|nr:PREDICTED: putative uncharacterized protein FLJ37770 [Dinoponera quadriceps]